MMTPVARGVYLADVNGLVPYRDTKHCVCVSAGGGRYFLVNTIHRDEYNDFTIKASDYPFLKGKDRCVACLQWVAIPNDRLLRQVGTLSDADAKTVYEKVKASHKIRKSVKKEILDELWKTFK